MEQNAYQILGLRKGANDAEIKRSYIDLVKTYDNERHTARYMVIEAAYKKLADPTKRAIEDIFSYNYPTGLFRFTLEEQEPLSDPEINQMVQDAEGKLAQNRDNAELQVSYIKALLMRAHKRCKKKLWAEAIEDWQRVLMVDPTHQRAKSNLLVAFGRLGCGFADSGLLEEAIDCWLKASQMNPDDDGMLHNLAISTEQLGRLDESNRYWQETLKRWQARLAQDPDNMYLKSCIIEVRRHHGESARQDGKQNTTSLEEYKEILKINPNDFEAQYKLATAMMEQHSWDEATQFLAQMMKQYPKNIEVLNLLGTALLNSGHIEQAFQIWSRALSIDPQNMSTRESIIKARMSIGKLFRKKGLHTQSLVHFKALLKYTPNSSEVYMEIGQTYMLKGDKRSAALAFERVTQLDPKNRMARQMISDMKLRA